MKEGRRISEASAQMMTFLVQDFLDYAQIKSCKFRTEAKPFDIREAVESVICIQKQKVSEIGIDLRAEYPGFADGEKGGRSPII
mmetsp:Transcript_3750/g.5673  ORF Transcript_3750/g.5673 Transcript_3750/m.5673 type:complete len:84 (-) Transcript_3750:1035-1286(-)